MEQEVLLCSITCFRRAAPVSNSDEKTPGSFLLADSMVKSRTSHSWTVPLNPLLAKLTLATATHCPVPSILLNRPPTEFGERWQRSILRSRLTGIFTDTWISNVQTKKPRGVLSTPRGTSPSRSTLNLLCSGLSLLGRSNPKFLGGWFEQSPV